MLIELLDDLVIESNSKRTYVGFEGLLKKMLSKEKPVKKVVIVLVEDMSKSPLFN